MPRLLCAISGHGYGHLSQCAALLNHLPLWLPDLQLQILCPLPTAVLAEQLTLPFHHIRQALDVGLVQTDALQVDLSATRTALRTLHHDWPRRLQSAEQQLLSLQPDLLLADIPYLALAAAAACGLPSVAIASLTWDAVLAAYFLQASDNTAQADHQQWWQTMREGYATTTLALLPAPSIIPHPFPHARHIDPLTLPGQRNPQRLRRLLQLDPADRRPLVLISLGGIPARHLPINALSQCPDCHWLIDAIFDEQQPYLHPIEPLRRQIPFRDLAASVDAVISKPGYNTAVAATLHQIPFLYIPRGTFPDEPFITNWVTAHGRARQLSAAQFSTAQWLAPLFDLLQQAPPPAPSAQGAEQAAALLTPMLR
ncbi:MAG: hypothetical protein HQM06_09035 [Magnetococcales bacterium]|nr:hypothetical protein [Magnetococcales bacterium]